MTDNCKLKTFFETISLSSSWSLAQLQIISLSHCFLDIDSLAALSSNLISCDPRNTTLKTLDLSGSAFGESTKSELLFSSLGKIASISGLTRLSLAHCDLEVFESLLQWKPFLDVLVVSQIQELSLRGNCIGLVLLDFIRAALQPTVVLDSIDNGPLISLS
jgi:hypothetical protein